MIKLRIRNGRDWLSHHYTPVQVLESNLLHFSEIEDDMARDKTEDPEWSRLAKALSLCIAYAANIGGTGSMIGSTPNLVLKGQIEKYA